MMRDMSLIDKTSDPCRVGLFSLGIGQQTYDPSGITPFFHGRDQQTSDACSVDRSGKDFHDSPHRCDMFVAWNGNYPFSPRRGGMSVEQITDLRPTPRRGDMSVDNDIPGYDFSPCRGDMFLSITFDLCKVCHFSAEYGQPTCDSCGIGILTFEIIQQTSDTCGVDRSGKDFNDSPHRCDMFIAWNGNYPFSPRRGGMSVEQITDLQPSPCKGDMILSITFDLCEVDYFFGEFGQQTYDPFGITPFFLGRDQQTSDTCGVLPYLYRLNYISPAAFGKYVHKYFDKEI